MSLIEKALEKKQNQQELNSASVTISQSKPQQDSKNSNRSHQSNGEAKNGNTKKTILLNETHLQHNGMITPDSSRSHIKEEFRFIKSKLLKNAFGAQAHLLDHPNLIMITSANPNEGKSYTAANLALAIALEQDKTVLLIDADVLKPSMCQTLGISTPKEGLIDYLLDEQTPLSDVIQSTNLERLKLISAGSKHHLTAELIGSDRMSQLANELSNRYPDRIIIFDAPPLLGVNETLNLANLVGQILLVVEEDKTAHRDVANAIALLDPNKAIGCVLNKASRKRNQYYGYGYGDYYS